MKLILLINVIMPTTVDILKVMSRKKIRYESFKWYLIGLVSKLNFMLSRLEHEINVITSDPELTPSILISHVVNLSNV